MNKNFKKALIPVFLLALVSGLFNSAPVLACTDGHFLSLTQYEESEGYWDMIDLYMGTVVVNSRYINWTNGNLATFSEINLWQSNSSQYAKAGMAVHNSTHLKMYYEYYLSSTCYDHFELLWEDSYGWGECFPFVITWEYGYLTMTLDPPSDEPNVGAIEILSVYYGYEWRPDCMSANIGGFDYNNYRYPAEEMGYVFNCRWSDDFPYNLYYCAFTYGQSYGTCGYWDFQPQSWWQGSNCLIAITTQNLVGNWVYP